jgi:hypothetical protein
MDILSGENLQLIATTILGYSYDFKNEYIIENSKSKEFIDFRCLRNYDNPTIMFCYGHRIDELSFHIHKFKNPFILISHNSDYNITDCLSTKTIVECGNLVKWIAQNVDYVHDKITFLPIGMANRMWEHGKISNFENITNFHKDKNIYMSFNIATNYESRTSCLDILGPKIDFLPIISPYENIRLLKRYKFCICPEGNGLDTHRLWEALYVKTVPILIKSTFSENIKNSTNIPMILLDNWKDLKTENLPDYDTFDFESCKRFLSIKFYADVILQTAHLSKSKPSLST